MLNPNLYAPVFTRKSVRKYAETPLTPAQLSMIKAEIAKAVPLLPGEKYKLELGEAREGWRIYGYCENTPLSNANLGFLLQQLDLALHLEGLGRLWFGMGREPKGSNPPKGLSYAMCLKVGAAAEPIARAGVNEFDRRPIQEIIDEDDLHTLFEAVRLAPSARNSQPWYFTEDNEKIQVWRRQPKLLDKLIIDRMNWVDMGIALCHAVLALENAGVICEIELAPPKKGLEGHDYLLTLDIDKLSLKGWLKKLKDEILDRD
ncbi:MAG: nitroreductase [Firmicutes bacterium]|nr:nitroreductase [Bacillota bacterium]